MSIVSAMQGHHLVRNGLNVAAPRATIFSIARWFSVKNEWSPIWRTLAKLGQPKRKSQQRRRLQTLLQIRLRLRNHCPRMLVRVNRPLVVRRQHRQLPPRRQRKRNLQLRIRLRPLRLHQILTECRQLILRPGIIDIFIRHEA